MTLAPQTWPLPCPLCATGAEVHTDDAIGRFFACPECDLIFRDPTQRLSPEQEAARYRQHRNSLDDPAYLAFLDRLVEPLSRKLAPAARGLDYGCGPVPGVALLLGRRGFPCESYDPLFHPDQSVLNGHYDFLACSEVIEHVGRPQALLGAFARLLRPVGVIGIMTQLHDASPSFASWWYRRDPTHVSFYSQTTLRWIARSRHWKLEVAGTGVALFTLPDYPEDGPHS